VFVTPAQGSGEAERPVHGFLFHCCIECAVFTCSSRRDACRVSLAATNCGTALPLADNTGHGRTRRDNEVYRL
jgi:hypothetical protein